MGWRTSCSAWRGNSVHNRSSTAHLALNTELGGKVLMFLTWHTHIGHLIHTSRSVQTDRAGSPSGNVCDTLRKVTWIRSAWFTSTSTGKYVGNIIKSTTCNYFQSLIIQNKTKMCVVMKQFTVFSVISFALYQLYSFACMILRIIDLILDQCDWKTELPKTLNKNITYQILRQSVQAFFLVRPLPIAHITHTRARTHRHTHTHTHSGGLLWTNDQLATETSTWQHTTLTTDRHPCPRPDLNPQSQQASGRRPTLKTARPPESAVQQLTHLS